MTLSFFYLLIGSYLQDVGARVANLGSDTGEKQNQLLAKLTELNLFANKHYSDYTDFLAKAHFASSCVKDLAEEDSAVATFMKYYGDDHDKIKWGEEEQTIYH